MNRYREERDSPTTQECLWFRTSAPPSSGVAGVYTYPNRLKTISDVVTPNYHSRISKGDIINNPCTITENETVPPGGTFNYQRAFDNGDDTYHSHYTGPIYDWVMDVSSPAPLNLDRSTGLDLVAMAKLKALSNIDSTPYSFAEDVAELRTTAKHLLSRGRSLTTLSRTLKRNVARVKRQTKRKTAAQISREVSQLYLEYRFAVSPLIRSIADLIEAFNEEPGKRPERRTARGFEQHRWDLSDRGSLNWLSMFRVVKTKGVEKVGAGILYTVDNPLYDFRFKYGLRNKDIPVTMWAIVPYSFMVDRVFNISQALRAVTNLVDPSVHIQTAWVRTSVEETTTSHCDGTFVTKPSGSTQTCTVGGTSKTSTSFTYNRTPWAPSLADAIPTPTWAKLADSFTKIADITALVHVNVAKGR